MKYNPKLGYPNRKGNNNSWSCVAFARYAYYYIFGNPWDASNPYGPDTATLIGTSLSLALPGDLIMWSGHQAIYIGNNQFYHANYNSTNKVSYGTGYGNGATPTHIYRANNYNTINGTSVYTFTLDRQNGEGGTGSFTVQHGTQIPASITPPTRPGYTFGGYYASTNGSGTQYYNASGSRVYTTNITSGNRTIYAKWTPKTYTVYYYANGGSNAPALHTKTHNVALPLSTNIPTAPAGSYTINFNTQGGNNIAAKTISRVFNNWNTAANGSGTSYNPGASYTENAALNLHAQWVYRAGALPLPVRPGYVFTGWYTSTSGGSRITRLSTIEGTTNLYARWDEYGIHHIKNASTGTYLNMVNPTTNNSALSLVANKIDTAAQKWFVQKLSNGFYEIRCFNSIGGNIGRIRNTGGATVGTGTAIDLTVYRNSDGTVSFRRQGTTAILAANGTGVVWVANSGTPTAAQKWHLEVHPQTYTQGDIIQDGVVDIMDSLEIQKYISEIPNVIANSAVGFYLADINRNGVVDIMDSLEILKKLAGLPNAIDWCE